MADDAWERLERQRLSRAALRAVQLERLNRVLDSAREQPFYRDRLRGVPLPMESLDDLSRLPLIWKTDLVAARPGEPGRIFGLPRERYTRFHQTSGTSGFPMPVYDTPEDWEWWIGCWQYVLDAAEVGSSDVVMMAFSFGPFIGFWTANDALVRRGAMVIPGGGMSSEARLTMIADHRCGVLCCTPTYALHLASVASQIGIDLASGPVTRVIVAGEPGGSIPVIRERIEASWGARVIDHAGASEVGAWGVGSVDGRGVHVIESEFIAEILHFDEGDDFRGHPVADGEVGELVLTNLGRFGGPAIRYRTGDLVRGVRDHDRENRFLWLDGGVLGRADDMLVVRGVNIFPSSVEAIVREVEPTAEFRVTIFRRDEMDQIEVELESGEDPSGRLAGLLRDRLAMRVRVRTVAAGTLPRWEAKARRWVDRRGDSGGGACDS